MHTARTSGTQNGVLMKNIGTICIQLIKLQMVEEICCRFKHELDHKQTLPGSFLARGEQRAEHLVYKCGEDMRDITRR